MIRRLKDSNRRRVALLAVGLAASMTAAACAGSSSSGSTTDTSGHFKLRLGSDQTANSVALAGDQYFADQVKQMTAGHVEIQTFPSGTLGTEAAMLTELQQGSLDLGDLATTNISGQLPILGLFDLPYIVSSQEGAVLLAKSSVTDDINKALESKGLTVYGLKPLGPLDLQGTKPVQSPADLQGYKVRVVTNPITVALFTKLGAIVTPLPPTQVYSALQQHVIDASIASLTATLGQKWYQPAPVLSQIKEAFLFQIVVGSSSALKRLPEQYQTAVRQAAAASVDYSDKQAPVDSARILDELRKANVKIVDTDLGAFKPIGEEVQKQFENQVGAAVVAKAREVTAGH